MKSQAQKNFRALRKYVGRDKELSPEEKEATLRTLADAANLYATVRAEVAPLIEAKKRAESDSYLERNGIENCPELYGKSVGETQAKYHNPLRMSAGGTDANPEVEEWNQALIGATVHTGDVEKPL